MQVRRLDSRRSFELRNPWVRNFGRTLNEYPNDESQCQRVRTESNKIIWVNVCGQQGSPFMWTHGSWLPWCPTTSYVLVKPEVSTRNGDRLPEVDRKSRPEVGFDSGSYPEVFPTFKVAQTVILLPIIPGNPLDKQNEPLSGRKCINLAQNIQWGRHFQTGPIIQS